MASSVKTYVPWSMELNINPRLERIGICSTKNSYLMKIQSMTREELQDLYDDVDTNKTLTSIQIKIVKKAIMIYKAIKPEY